jgi:anti-sigma regulatory factor (Ser/Thr protein kinase)
MWASLGSCGVGGSTAMCWQVERDFGGDPRTPGLARDFVGAGLDATLASAARSEIVDDAGLVVSELVTNAVAAGSNRVLLAVRLHRRQLTIAVTDDGPGWPTPRSGGPEDPSGRGLLIVGSLAQAWGVERLAGDRKQVWASLPVPEELTRSLHCAPAVG